MSAASRLALVTVALLSTVGFAQIQVDDRPKYVETVPLTKEELNRRKADQLLREARTLFALGIIRQRHEKLVESVTTLEKALAIDPDSLELRRALAPAYVAVGRDTEAMKLCKHVLDRDPHDAEIAFQYARLLRVDSRPAEAIAVLQTAVTSKNAEARPERLLYMLSDLSDLLEKRGDFAGMAKAQESMIRVMTDYRDQLLYGTGQTREGLQENLGRAYERLGQARVQKKEYDRAAAAFRSTRDVLLNSEDPEARHQAVRIYLNLSEIAAAQGRWSEALQALDAYLEHAPVQIEPYEKKVELLRKLGRDREVIPTLRKYVARDQYHLGLQLLLASELAKDAGTRRDAEKIYTTLLEKNVKPEVYRGLFHLYRLGGEPSKVLDLFDASAAIADKPEAKADEREAAQARVDAMLGVLRSDPVIVEALLRDARAELVRSEKRETKTWFILASLATRTRQLAVAEQFFRQCLQQLPADQEVRVYLGLFQVLMRQRKYKDVVSLCQDALAHRAARNGTESIFHPPLAVALAALGQYDEALVHADKAIRLTSDEWKVVQHCRKALILAQAGRYADGVRECEETLKEFKLMTQVQEIRQTLSQVYSMQGDHAKSEEQLRLILEMDPDVPLANNNLGYQMADRNVNLDDAERLIRRAIEADRSSRRQADDDGDNAAYLDSLGWVLFRKGKLTEAREWLEKAAALPDGADDPTVWEHLGDVYVKLDLPGKAKESWHTSLKMWETAAKRKGETRPTEVEKKLKTLER